MKDDYMEEIEANVDRLIRITNALVIRMLELKNENRALKEEIALLNAAWPKVEDSHAIQ